MKTSEKQKTQSPIESFWGMYSNRWHYFENDISVCHMFNLKKSWREHPYKFKPNENQRHPFIEDICIKCKKNLNPNILNVLPIRPIKCDLLDNTDINYDLFMRLTRDVPFGLDKSIKKETIPKEIRESVIIRDKYSCQICRLEDDYGNPGWGIAGKLAIHHIIPNGPATLENLITTCKHCHNAVHLMLYVSGKWRYVPMQ